MTTKSKRKSPTRCFEAREFDLARGEWTGRREVYCAPSLAAAGRALAYTRNLSTSGWAVSKTGQDVVRKAGDITWHLRREGATR